MVLVGNDDSKKMIERDEAERFVLEYSRVTGVRMELVGIGERPDFVCEKEGRQHGLELVAAMQNPVDREWDIVRGGDGQLHGLDASYLVQHAVLAKDEKRQSPGWHLPGATILAVQLIASDGDELLRHLEDEIMDELTDTGFSEIWVMDYSPMDEYGEIQLIGIKPERWHGVHRHRLYGTKPYG